MKKSPPDTPLVYVFWAIPMAPFLNGCECTFMPNGDASCEAQQENIKASEIVATFPIEEGKRRHEKLKRAAAEYRERHRAITREVRDKGNALMDPEEDAAC